MCNICSFNRSSERQYSLRAPDALDEPIVLVDLDTSNGVMFPLYDPDTNLIFLCGKGDSVIRYFEVSAFILWLMAFTQRAIIVVAHVQLHLIFFFFLSFLYRLRLRHHLYITSTRFNRKIHNAVSV